MTGIASADRRSSARRGGRHFVPPPESAEAPFLVVLCDPPHSRKATVAKRLGEHFQVISYDAIAQRHVKWAMHTFSDPMAEQVGAPIGQTLPGLPVFGIHGYPDGFSGWESQLLYVYENRGAGQSNFFPPPQQWPDLRLFADVGWVPILSEHSVSSTMLHTTFLYGGLLAAGSAAR